MVIRKISIIIWVLLFFGLFLVIFAFNASAADVYVSPDQGDGWYDATHVKTIAEGITNATADDTLHLWAGTYNENIDIDKSLTIVGNSSSNTTIDGVADDHVISITVDWVNISKLAITDAGTNDAVVYITANNTYIDNCSITDGYDGILFERAIASYNLSIYDNTISTITDEAIAVYTTHEINNVTIQNNTISNADYGISFYNDDGGSSNNINISNNHISSCEEDCIDITGYDNFLIEHNTLLSGNSYYTVIFSNFDNITFNYNNVSQYIHYGIAIWGAEKATNFTCLHNEVNSTVAVYPSCGIWLCSPKHSNISHNWVNTKGGTDGAFGILIKRDADGHPSPEDNVVSYNDITTDENIGACEGLYLHLGDYQVYNNNIHDCEGVGVETWYISNSNFHNNTVSGNTEGGLYLYYSSNILGLSDNSVYNNGNHGIYVNSKTTSLTVTIENGNVSDNTGHGVYITDVSNSYVINVTTHHNAQNDKDGSNIFGYRTGNMYIRNCNTSQGFTDGTGAAPNYRKCIHFDSGDTYQDDAWKGYQYEVSNCTIRAIGGEDIYQSERGIQVSMVDDVTIRDSYFNNTKLDCFSMINIYGMSNNYGNLDHISTYIISNTFENTWNVLYAFENVSGSKVYDNTFTENNQCLFFIDGRDAEVYNNFFDNTDHVLGFADYGEDGQNCSFYNNTITNLTSGPSSSPIYLASQYSYAYNNTITNVQDCDDAVMVVEGYYSHAYNNIIENVSGGAAISVQYYGYVYNNTINNSYNGIYFDVGYISYIYNNTITNCSNYGMELYWAEDCYVYSNRITDCGIGIYSDSNSYTCDIYNNYFDNTVNVDCNSVSGHSWNIAKTLGTNIIGGPYLGGNYWSDYNGTDENDDYLGDTEYTINSGDQYPLFPFLARFTYSPKNPMVDETITFFDYSNILTGSIDTYFWNLVDKTTTGRIIKHSYDEQGDYDVQLILYKDGFIDFAVQTVTVKDDGFRIELPDPKYPFRPYTVPEMYQLLRVDKLPKSHAELIIVFIDTGYTPRAYESTDLSRIKPLDSNPIDQNGHGTWVSYAIQYILQEKLPNAQLYSYRVFDETGYCTGEQLLAAFNKIKEIDPDIVSFSGGGPGNPDDAFSKKVGELRNSGIIVIVAAGNSGPGAGTILSPACSRGALAIGATDPMRTILELGDDRVCDWSSRGPVKDVKPKPDYTSPGESIIGPWLKTDRVVSGTSMAAPLVAGGIAVAYANNKLLLDIVGILYFLVGDIKQGVIDSSVMETVYTKTPSTSYGYGIPDFEDAASLIFWKCIILIIIWFIVFSAIVCAVVYAYKKFKKKDKKKKQRKGVSAGW